MKTVTSQKTKISEDYTSIPEGQRPYDFDVNDEAINVYSVLQRYENGSTLQQKVLSIPREAFVEAYNKWIKGE